MYTFKICGRTWFFKLDSADCVWKRWWTTEVQKILEKFNARFSVENTFNSSNFEYEIVIENSIGKRYNFTEKIFDSQSILSQGFCLHDPSRNDVILLPWVMAEGGADHKHLDTSIGICTHYTLSTFRYDNLACNDGFFHGMNLPVKNLESLRVSLYCAQIFWRVLWEVCKLVVFAQDKYMWVQERVL